MKSILIVTHAMEIGGAETALLGLLETIDTEEYEVDLFLMRHSGELMQYIPSTINLLPEISQYASLAIPIGTVIKRGNIGIAMGRVVGKYKARKRVKELGFSGDSVVALEYSHKYTKKMMPKISGKEYDLAISFLTPHYFVAEKVSAKKRIAWIHTDYSIVKVDIESELKMWFKYDYIASISDNVTQSFLKTFPLLKDRVRLIENIMPMQYIKNLVKEFPAEWERSSEGCVKLLSIGRFTSSKKFDEIPAICRKIREFGIDVKWYLIGYGGEEQLIRQEIVKECMEDYVIILGKKENPYPYIKACDIYLQPSRYEGKSVAVREAQSLNKPVIITDFPTAQSQLKDGYDGIIVPMDIQGSAEGIIEVINNISLQQKLVENTMKNDYSNADEIEKLYELLEEVNKKVSVVVPVYNKEKELKKCLDSIIQQTYSELEIIIIDDGFQDCSLTICKKFGEIDQRVQVYSKVNEGVEKARLYGIEKAQGDYIMFVDSDDWLAKNAIESLVKTLEENDADVSFAASTRVLDSWGVIKRKNIPEIYKQGVIEHDEFVGKHLQSFSGCGTFPISIWAKMYRSKLLKDIEPVGLVYGEDLCFNLQVLPKAKRIVGCPEALYFYRWGGVTTNVQERVFLDAIKQYEYKIPYYLKYGKNDCVEKSNIELINYFYTYVDACVLKYEKDLFELTKRVDKALRNEVFQNAAKNVKREQIVSQESYQAIVNKDVQKIISLKRNGIRKKKMKRRVMNIIHDFLR